MMKTEKNKTIAIVSAIIFFIGLATFNISGLGIVPVFIVVISFFTSLIHGWLYLSGHKETDVFTAYQDGAKTKAKALHSGFKGKAGKE
ncbi:hypothetical protein C9J03_11235 [Photobacterium gaetbulicola]|uniref:Uncharacterized protein n=1 Tax=Photobacterium gaetbulicola Gung47 TaxID=658445 RepID=A0A0C5X1R1_9GAMM|nr:hypothetical protein [Photobacterium gaetbulicola]AJR09245.1 hypothetical protein H744_2c2589 [Photobacterium gaetbulicola Gung47]PSU11709.1 hypothetical protein C9J03_11235 [Photobacterium gaetbulicola]